MEYARFVLRAKVLTKKCHFAAIFSATRDAPAARLREPQLTSAFAVMPALISALLHADCPGNYHLETSAPKRIVIWCEILNYAPPKALKLFAKKLCGVTEKKNDAKTMFLRHFN